MRKVLFIFFILSGLFVKSQTTQIIYTNVLHGDTSFLVKITNTYQLDSQLRYIYTNHQQCDSVLVQDTMRWVCTLILDTTSYWYPFKTLTGTVKDSIQVSQPNIRDTIIWLRNQMFGLIANNSTPLGRDILNLINPASNSVVVATPAGSAITRTSVQLLGDIGLDQVNNTSDANKPVSSATQTALNLKANLASPTFTGTVSGITATMVGLGNVTNESKATMFTSPTFTGNAVLGTPASGNFSTGVFTWPTFNQNTTGSAATLTTPRTIQGVSFNGSANINIISGTGFVKASGTTLSYDNSTYQPLATNLTSIGALANGSGYLKNNGSGTFTYETPAGAGTVTNTGNLTSNAVVLGNGNSDTKVVTGVTTDGTAQLILGVSTTTLGSVKMFGNTSGDATIQPPAVAGTNTVITLPNVTSTLLPNTTTSGIAATATASGTQTIIHNLGRTPTIIRIYSVSNFTNSTSATPVPFSMGVFNSSGNRCVYMVINGTTAQVSQTSTVFSIIMVTSAGNQITGVIGNVTSTGFDITWSETGTHTAGNFMWEAQ